MIGYNQLPIIHYWKRVLCRGPKALPRTKSRSLGKNTLCRGPATGALSKERPSAKIGPRQIKSLPRAAVLGKDALGKLGPLGHGGHSRQALPRATRQALGKGFFFCETSFSAIFLKSLCRGPQTRPSAKIFFEPVFRPNFFFINRLCRGPEARPSAKKPFAEGQARPSAKIFFLVFLAQFFCGATIHCFELNFKIWANFDFFCIFP